MSILARLYTIYYNSIRRLLSIRRQQEMSDREQTSAREEILGRLRPLVRDGQHPQPWQSRRQFPDLAERFTTALTAAGGEVHHLPSLAEAFTCLESLLQELNAQRIIANNEHPLSLLIADLGLRIEKSPNLPVSESPNLQSLISNLHSQYTWHITGHTPGDLRAFCASADVGLTGAEAALAETGSVVVSSGPGKSRLASLLPPVHIAFVATSQLTADIFTWTAARQGQLPANVVLISGPSKSADIERVLAVGVHGPKRFIALLYDE